MKILMVDKFYFVKGGVERYLFELQKIFEARGHEVIPFSMVHAANAPSPYAEYFIDNVEYSDINPVTNPWKSLKAAGRVLYSFHAKRKLEYLLNRVKPDVAHIHMIDHQISPSILHTLKRHNIPVIQTVHQYKLVCPNYRFYIEEKGEICERCLKGGYFNAFLQKCHKGSAPASFLITAEAYLHKILKMYKHIDKFHVPSRFIGKKLVEGGIPENKLINHFLTLNIDEYPFQKDSRDYFLYYGRLSGEKGLFTLLEAVRQKQSNVRLVIVGEGPSRQALEKFVGENNLNTVSFLGYQSGDTLKYLLAGAQFVVVPSEWYENSPFVIYEPFCMGKPVIGANIGGIPEFIEHGQNGLLFESGNWEQLAESIDQLALNQDACRQMGIEARKFADANFLPDSHYEWLHNIYTELIKEKKIQR